MTDNILNLLGIDWGTKYIGLASYSSGSNIIMPIGYIINDGDMYYNLGDLIIRNQVTKIIVGYPKKQKNIQDLINKFIVGLGQIINEDIEIKTIGEDYTSVEAEVLIGNYQKDLSKDTIAAMKILGRWISRNID